MKEYRAGRRPARIKLPPVERAGKEEAARRVELGARILARRKQLGPISDSVAELIREDREESGHG